MKHSKSILINLFKIKTFDFTMNRIFKSLLIRRGIYVGHVINRGSLNDFFKKIKPVQTNHNLIRLGGAGDGGYLVPDDLIGIEYCFSPGVSAVADFELDLTKRNITCFLADYSVDGPPIKNSLFDFEKKYLGLVEDDVFTTLEGWVRRKAENNSDLILQMDIEGAEYAVINDVSQETLNRFRVVVVEFHNLSALLDASAFDLISITFDKILKSFDVIHIHPTNCCAPVKYKEFSIPPVIEFTFLRKDRISERSPCTAFPHILDSRNVPSNPDLVLPACWFYNAS